MKPFLGIDVTENDGKSSISGEEFIVSKARSVEDEPIQSPDTDEETPLEAEESKKKEPIKHYLPLWTRIIRFVSGLGAIAFILFAFRIYMLPSGDIYMSEYLKRKPWIFILGGAAILIWLVLNVVEGILESRAAKLAEAEAENDLESEASDIIEVPENAVSVDILVFNYTVTDGEVQTVAHEDAISAYFNYGVSAFSDENNLYVCTLDEKYAIPLSSLIAIHTVDEEIAIPDWNKDVPPTQGIYKPYKLSVDNLDRITFKPYHIVELDHNGEKWGIYFPSYELPAFEALTGLKAE